MLPLLWRLLGLALLGGIVLGEAGGQERSDAVVPDIRSAPQDLVVPEMVEGRPEPGRRVKRVLSGDEDTKVFHASISEIDP